MSALPKRVLGCPVLVVAVSAAIMTGCTSQKPDQSTPSEQSQPAGTPVTLTARTADLTPPTPESMQAARDIIEARAKGLDLTGTKVVVIDSNRLVITVPGDDGSKARALGNTSKLYLRPVLASLPATGSGPADLDVATARINRQSIDPTAQERAVVALDCSKPDPLHGDDDPNLPLATCSTDGKETFLLDKSLIDGHEIASAKSLFDSRQDRYMVEVTFKSGGSDAFSKFTSDNLGKRIAFTLDSRVLSAPAIQSPTPPGSPTQISGNFTADSARQLANSLQSGALPLSFTVS